jgi:hypothetical protein
MPFPFEVSFAEVKKNLDIYVMEVFLNLQSEFMELPKGPGFIEYPVFEQGYEALKRATRDFGELVPDHVLATVYATPITFIVLRTMLGFTPPEWAYVTEQHTHTPVPQGAARTLDRRIRIEPLVPTRGKVFTLRNLEQLIACTRLGEFRSREQAREQRQGRLLHPGRSAQYPGARERRTDLERQRKRRAPGLGPGPGQVGSAARTS